MKNPITDNIKQLLATKLVEIETHFAADAIAFYGGIKNGLEDSFLQAIEFKDWGTDAATKKARAEEIAAKLSDNNLWHIHGRPINVKTLNDELKLKIEDYSTDLAKRHLIRSYQNLVEDYVKSYEIWAFLQTRKTF